MSGVRVKRTYNLPYETVQTVRRLAEHGVAASQDAVVERAIDDLARRIREAEEADAWARAAEDPLFTGEMRALDAEFATADAETWPPE